MSFKHSNCIVVFNKDKASVLFCKRTKDPFQGLYNFVGGKVEPGEGSEDAAYRELQEETGIGKQDIRLYRLMDLTYYHQNFILEIYAGVLKDEVILRDEVNPLQWFSLADHDFTDRNCFAGEQNIAHIINVALKFPFDDTLDCEHNSKGRFIGVDGCKKGWIVALLENGNLEINRYDSIEQIVDEYPVFDGFLIDMAIGLQSSKEEKRPDDKARKLLGSRSSTVFPVPARAVVHVECEDKQIEAKQIELKQKEANKRVLGKSLAKQSLAIIPKIKELDDYLNANTQYKNVICESHPELCFARLNGSVLMSKKKEYFGFCERANILSKYLGRDILNDLCGKNKDLQCNPDDILDAVCLALVAKMNADGLCQVIAEEPNMDSEGLLMQMIVPKENAKES